MLHPQSFRAFCRGSITVFGQFRLCGTFPATTEKRGNERPDTSKCQAIGGSRNPSRQGQRPCQEDGPVRLTPGREFHSSPI